MQWLGFEPNDPLIMNQARFHCATLRTSYHKLSGLFPGLSGFVAFAAFGGTMG